MELANVWGDLENMTTNMSVSCLYTVGVMKIYAFFGHRDKFKKLIGGISNMEKFIVVSEDEDIKTAFRAYVQRAQFVTNFFCSLTIGTIIVFFAVPPVEYTFSSVYHRVYDNGTEFWSYERPMIFSSWFPFDKYAKTNYLIAYLYHVLMGIIGSAYQAIWDTFIVTMMLHSIGQLQILQINVKNMTSFHEKNKIKKFSDDASLNQILEDRYKDKKMYERLVNCVYHHRYISKYFKYTFYIKYISILNI